MTASKGPASGSIYQLKLTLVDSRPPIWRRVQVPGDVSLAALHDVIQAAMGWEDYHLHQFIVGGTYYGPPIPELPLKNERAVKLSEIAPAEKARFAYEYDFGDSWGHEILVEKILAPERGKPYPVCLAGERACPPEDSGGLWGYYELLETVRDPDDPEREDMLDWLGEEFDPEAFDLEAINEELRNVTI